MFEQYHEFQFNALHKRTYFEIVVSNRDNVSFTLPMYISNTHNRLVEDIDLSILLGYLSFVWIQKRRYYDIHF